MRPPLFWLAIGGLVVALFLVAMQKASQGGAILKWILDQ